MVEKFAITLIFASLASLYEDYLSVNGRAYHLEFAGGSFVDSQTRKVGGKYASHVSGEEDSHW